MTEESPAHTLALASAVFSAVELLQSGMSVGLMVKTVNAAPVRRDIVVRRILSRNGHCTNHRQVGIHVFNSYIFILGSEE